MTTTIAVAGVTGRMGRAIAAAIPDEPDVQLAAATARPATPFSAQMSARWQVLLPWVSG